jgi:PleD family two-component response regulator
VKKGVLSNSTITISISIMTEGVLTSWELFKQAGEVLYDVKESGRNRSRHLRLKINAISHLRTMNI